MGVNLVTCWLSNLTRITQRTLNNLCCGAAGTHFGVNRPEVGLKNLLFSSFRRCWCWWWREWCKNHCPTSRRNKGKQKAEPSLHFYENTATQGVISDTKKDLEALLVIVRTEAIIERKKLLDPERKERPATCKCARRKTITKARQLVNEFRDWVCSLN